MVKSGLEFILKLTEPLQSCCCPVQKYLPRMAELAWQLSRYLWRGSVNFKINSRPLFTIIFKVKNDNFKTRDFSPLIERVLTGVSILKMLIGFAHIFCTKIEDLRKVSNFAVTRVVSVKWKTYFRVRNRCSPLNKRSLRKFKKKMVNVAP